jgi:hypothetical protein
MRLNERIVSGFGNACMTGYRAPSSRPLKFVPTARGDLPLHAG